VPQFPLSRTAYPAEVVDRGEVTSYSAEPLRLGQNKKTQTGIDVEIWRCELDQVTTCAWVSTAPRSKK